MSSGVKILDNCKVVFEEIKTDKKHRYVIFKISQDKQVEVEKIGKRDSEYNDFLAELRNISEHDCRYGLLDYDSQSMQKLLLMLWCPEGASVKSKMIYETTFGAFRKALDGVDKYVQVCDMEEASQESIEEMMRNTA